MDIIPNTKGNDMVLFEGMVLTRDSRVGHIKPEITVKSIGVTRILVQQKGCSDTKTVEMDDIMANYYEVPKGMDLSELVIGAKIVNKRRGNLPYEVESIKAVNNVMMVIYSRVDKKEGLMLFSAKTSDILNDYQIYSEPLNLTMIEIEEVILRVLSENSNGCLNFPIMAEIKKKNKTKVFR